MTRFFVTGAAAVIASSAALAQAPGLYFSANDGVFDFSGQSVRDDDVIRTDSSNSFADIVFSDSADVNAFHITADGTYLYSGLFGTQDDDIIAFDPNMGTTTTLLNGESVFSAGSVDIDSISMDASGNLILSMLSDSIHIASGQALLEGDLFSYNLANNTVSILIAEADLFDDGSGDISAAHDMGDGTYLLGFNADETISGLTVLEGTVIRYDAANDTASIFQNLGDIELDALYFAVPTPGAAGLFAIAGLTAARRRR